MIPPPDRHETPSTAERRAQAEALKIARMVLDVVRGIEARTIDEGQKVGSLAIMWDTCAVMLALLRRESEARGVSWEEVEHKVNADSAEWIKYLTRAQ